MAANDLIDTPAKRKQLTPRREPYWQEIVTGQYIGFRRTDTGGSWHARLTRDRRSVYEALGGEDVLITPMTRRSKRPWSGSHTRQEWKITDIASGMRYWTTVTTCR